MPQFDVAPPLDASEAEQNAHNVREDERLLAMLKLSPSERQEVDEGERGIAGDFDGQGKPVLRLTAKVRTRAHVAPTPPRGAATAPLTRARGEHTRASGGRPKRTRSRPPSGDDDPGGGQDPDGERHPELAPRPAAILRFGCLSPADRGADT